jgi:signal peptidase I
MTSASTPQPRIGPRRERRRRAHARRPGRVTRVLVEAPLVLALLLGGVFVVGSAGGYRLLVIASGSMRPTLQVGDLVLSRSTAPSRLRPGDLVTFADPLLGGRSVTHRVVQLARDGDRFAVQTRGDANQVSEHWTVPADGRVGLAVQHVPGPGPWLLWLRRGPAPAVGVFALAALLGSVLVRRIWAAR